MNIMRTTSNSKDIFNKRIYFLDDTKRWYEKKKKSTILQHKQLGRSTVIAEIHYRVCMLQTVFSPDSAGLTNAFSIGV